METFRIMNITLKKPSLKKTIAAGVIAASVVGGAALAVPSLAGAHGGDRGAKAELVAETLGITVEDLQAARAEGQSIADIAGDDLDAVIDAFVAEATDRIETKVADGSITQEQADEKLAGLEDKITDRVNRTPGERGEGRHGRRGHRGHRGFGASGELVAETLDMTTDELRDAMADGQSLAEIAGDDLDAVIDAMVQSVADRIDAKVADGSITQEEADEKLAELEAKLTEKANEAPRVRGGA